MLKNLRPGNGAEVFCFLGSLANLQDSSLQEPESHSWLLKEAENHHEAQKGHEETESKCFRKIRLQLHQTIEEK